MAVVLLIAYLPTLADSELRELLSQKQMQIAAPLATAPTLMYLPRQTKVRSRNILAPLIEVTVHC